MYVRNAQNRVHSILHAFECSKENKEDSESMEIEEQQITPTKPSDGEKSEGSPNKETPPPKVTQVSLPLSLQFLHLGHEALGG